MAGGGIEVRKYPRVREHEKFIYNLLTHQRVSGAAVVDSGVVREAWLKFTAPLRHRFILDGPLLVFFSLVCLAQMLVSGNKRCADTGSASFGRGGGGGKKPLSSGLKKSFPLTSSLTPLSPLSPAAAAAPLPNPVSATSRPHLCMKCAYIESTQKKGEMGAEEVTQAISQNRGPQCDI